MNGQTPGADATGDAAQRLRSLRASLELSQEQLARQLGVSFATVNRWETGRTTMSPRAAQALAAFEAPLPAAHTRFVGRERELAELSSLLASSRLTTVTGPGGVGKTRLVIEALRRCGRAEPTTFIPLEPVRHPRSLIPAVASSLRVRSQAGLTLGACVEAAVAMTPRLIVLDGAEHLRDEVARLVTRLLTGAGTLRIVVTSRVVLGVPGEMCWTVPPLACPGRTARVSEIARSDAVRLFMARASERLPGLAGAGSAPRLVAELCRRLDCLPLAIELIAGWAGTFSVQQILDQGALRLASEPAAAEQPAGHGLGEVVRSSYALLRPRQRRLLPALSVFAGPFTAEDAAAVSGDGDSAGPSASARALRGLVDSSWLIVEHGAINRYRMLETMRVFAAARLGEQEDAAGIRRRHAAHFAALACASEVGLAGPGAAAWAARLDAALADLDVALRWADESGETELGLRMSAALWRWWLTSGQLAEGREWLGKFLPAAARRRDELSGRALRSAAVLAAENGDYAEAVRLARAAFGIFQALGLAEPSAFAATVLGSAHRYLGERDAARRCFETAMTLRADSGDRHGVSVAMNNLALMALDDGDLVTARANLEQALVIKRQLGDQHSLAVGLVNLSDLLIRAHEFDAARRALTEGSELARSLGDPKLTGLLEANYGFLAATQGDWAQAASHYHDAALTHQQGGHPHDIVVALTGLGRAEHRLGRIDEAIRHLRAAEAMATGIANPQRLAEVRAALAEAGEARGPAMATAPPGGLTLRQAEVLRLLAAGLSNKQIAAELQVSPLTVERHVATIYRKLGLGGRVEAARYAVTHGLASML